jgi:CubicO group peptidase (beta-lactamase class C family)
MIRRSWPVAFALAIALPLTPGALAHEPTLTDRVRAAHREAAPAAPALAAVRVRCGARPETAVIGVARADLPRAVLAQGRFNIGSNAKSVLASLAATFVEEGRVGWDTTVAEVFKAEAATFHPTLRRATLAQLLAHRSGLPAYTSGRALDAVKARGADARERRLSFALQVLRAEPAQAPGAETLYSNAGYVVAGAMLERIGERSFELLAQDRLFRPLGIKAEFGTPPRPEPGHPWGHTAPAKVHISPEPIIPDFLQSAGDVSLSMRDYGLYLREHLCGLQGRQTRLLKPATVRLLHGGAGEAGLGWGRLDSAAGRASMHVGGTGAFTTYVVVVPGRNVALATSVNSGSDEAGAAARKLLLELIAAEAK